MGAQMTDLGFDFRSGSTEITFEYHKHTQKWVLERPAFYKTCYASSCTEETYDTEIRSLTEPIINPWETQSIWIKNHVKKSFQRPWVGSSGQNSSIWNHRILSQICPWQKFDLSDQGDLRFMKTFLTWFWSIRSQILKEISIALLSLRISLSQRSQRRYMFSRIPHATRLSAEHPMRPDLIRLESSDTSTSLLTLDRKGNLLLCIY